MRRLTFLGVPVDEASLDSCMSRVQELASTGDRHQIVFLSTAGMLRARRDPEFRQCLTEAAMVLPISARVVKAMRSLGQGEPQLFAPFEFVIRLLGVAEDMGKAVYLLGARKEDLEKAEKSLRVSFPSLRLVGRFSGFFKRDMEESITLAIRKSAPTFLLVGRGTPGTDMWIYRHKQELHSGVFIYVDNCFEIFSGRESRFAGLSFFLRRPWRVLSLLNYAYLAVLVLVYRIFGRGSRSQ